MTLGSVLAALLLLAWSRVETLWGFYALWAGLGLASAAVLYEPAFTVVANWFVRHRGRALTVLTFMGGFASVIFVPVATGFVAARGWRKALVWLAGVMAVGTIPAHALLLRRRPEDHGLRPDGESPGAWRPHPHGEPGEPNMSAREIVRSPSFVWLGAAFGLSTLVSTGLLVHLIPLLLERGYSAGFAAAAVGSLGLMALPGRLVFTPLGSRWPRASVTATIFALQALAMIAILADAGAWAIWAFVALFGAGLGAITPARAALLAELYGPSAYGRISGVMALVQSGARAAAPVGVSLIHATGRGYGPLLLAALVLCLGSAASVLRGGVRISGAPASTV